MIELGRVPVGICGIKWSGTSASFWNVDGAEPDLGYSLVPAYRGRGYIDEASRAVLDIAFDSVPAACVIARCTTANVASARVLQRLGMIETGFAGRLRAFRLDRSDFERGLDGANSQ